MARDAVDDEACLGNASATSGADLPDPDLIIRTSGEIRLSGFLLWQNAYSEFYSTEVLWPAFRRIDFLRAVRAWQQRLGRHRAETFACCLFQYCTN